MENVIWNKTRIKELRDKLGLTQIELAQRLKISIDSLRSYERESRRPSLKIQQRLNRQARKIKQ